MTDLFLSKKEQLLEWMQPKVWVKTSEVIKWGVDNFCNRAERYARDLAEEGKITRMDNSMKRLSFGNIKEDVWIVE